MRVIYDFTRPIQDLVWVANKRTYHADERNQLVETGVRADSLTRDLYLYLYSNRGHRHPIRNKNQDGDQLGKVICPADFHCIKSGKFEHGLHEHIRKNVHGHLWRPNATPAEDHIAPRALCWFLVFETDPTARASPHATQQTREKYFANATQ